MICSSIEWESEVSKKEDGCMKHIKSSMRLLFAIMLLLVGHKDASAIDTHSVENNVLTAEQLTAELGIDADDFDASQTKICLPLPVPTWPPVSDIVDTNVTIGNATLPAGPTHIRACTTDVCINMNGTVQGAPGAESQLHIEASDGRTVTINILGDSAFVGSSTGQDLLIVFRGNGNIIFQFDLSATFTFGKNGVGGGSVKSFLITNCPATDTDPIPTIIFRRTAGLNCASPDDVGIIYGEGSLFTFASAGGNLSARTVQGCAHVVFNPSNAGTGRMYLEIQDQAAFIIAGNVVNAVYTSDPCAPVVDFTLAQFDLTTPVFQDFRMEVMQNVPCNAACGGDLMVLNNNVTMGELLIDPWCNLGTRADPNFIGTFDGVRYGFIIGANGTLTIGDNSSLDYVELGLMICPDVAFPVLVPQHSSLKKRNPAAMTIDGSNNPIALNANIDLGVNSGLFFRSGVDVNGVVEVPFGNPFEFTIDFSLRTPGAGNTVLSVEGPLDVFGSDVQNPLNNLLYTPNSKIEILSFYVQLTAELFNCCNPGCFPRKTFVQDINGNYYRYNAASFLIHGNMTLNNVTLVQSDENHNVYEKNDVLSEPTYVGGDVVPCVTNPAVAYMAFINSALWVETDVAFTGVDLLVPNGNFPASNVVQLCGTNTSRFIFFQNGLSCDKGFGRNMILGTLQGSVACDNCTVINANTQLDVMQITDCAQDPANQHLLNLQVAQNLPCSTQEIFCCTAGICPGPVDPCGVGLQTSIHSIFLGNQSNISIGTQTAITSNQCFVPFGPMMRSFADVTKAPAALTSHPTMQICGNFFAFETHGGITCIPSDSPVTGTGGIFVDSDGTLSICPGYRAFFGATVTQSSNPSILNGSSTVNLPNRQIVWAPHIGIAAWNINLANPLQQATIPTSACDPLVYVPIINANETYSEYKFDWLTTQKDYALFCPYKTGLLTPCVFPPVVCSNIQALPTVLGTVDQFQITGSRLGDPANISVIGGLIREFIYINSGHSGEEPTSVITLSDQGSIGLGTAHRNTQSLEASIVLGANGVTIIANGDGQVNLNEDVIIDNVWQIARGPDFNGNTLTIASENGSSIRVVSGACLDLSQFQEGDVVRLAGNMQLILEPGACITFGGSGFAIPCGACALSPTSGGTLVVAENAKIVLEPVVKTDALIPVVNPGADCDPHPEVDYTLVNPVRVRLMGKGVIQLANNASFDVPKNAYLGIETLKPCTPCSGQGPQTPPCSLDNCEIPYTDITLLINDSARFNIGNNVSELGGAVQIGNVQPHTFPTNCGVQDASVVFTLLIEGENARLSVGTQGFLGFGVGITDKSSDIPNQWLVSSLYNVNLINLLVPNGTFAHERIFSGEEGNASLLAFSNDDATVYNFFFTPITVDPLNPNEPLFMIDIAKTTFLGGGNMALINSAVSIHPIIRCVDGVMTASLTVSLLKSTPMFEGAFVGSTAADLFTFLRAPVIPTVITVSGPATDALGIANTALSNNNNQIRLGYVDNCLIGRVYGTAISGDGDYQTKQTHAVAVGGIPILIDGTPPTPGVDCANPCSLPCIAPGNPGGPRPIIVMFDQLGEVL
jgi:hypothetical protein